MSSLAKSPTMNRMFVITLLLLVALPLTYAAPRAAADTSAQTQPLNTQPQPSNPAAVTGITITPSQKELVVSSGLINARTEIVLTNHTGKNLEATVRLVDFKSLDDTGGIALSQPGLAANKYGLANWMELPNGNMLTLLDGQSTTIPVIVVNRFDLTPGAHYGAVVVTIGGSSALTSNQASFKQELASLLFVKKLGGEDYSLQLQSLVADHGHTAVPDSATLRFKSAGNVYVVPRGYVTVTDDKSVVYAKGIINAQSNLVLPGTSRQFITPLQTIAPATKHSGRFKLTAYYRYDGQKNYSQMSTYISSAVLSPLVISVLIITGVIGGLALLFILRKVARRAR
jgi:hypothetical protein